MHLHKYVTVIKILNIYKKKQWYKNHVINHLDIPQDPLFLPPLQPFLSFYTTVIGQNTKTTLAVNNLFFTQHIH